VAERVTRDDRRRSAGSRDDVESASVDGGSSSSLRAAGHRSAAVHEALQSLRGRLRAPAALGHAPSLQRALLQVRTRRRFFLCWLGVGPGAVSKWVSV